MNFDEADEQIDYHDRISRSPLTPVLYPIPQLSRLLLNTGDVSTSLSCFTLPR